MTKNSADLLMGDPQYAVQRVDVEAAVAAHRRESSRDGEWLLAIGGVAGTLAIWTVGLRSSNERLMILTFVGGWAALISINVLMARRYRARVARYGLACPGCSQPLIELAEPRFWKKRADAVLASGRCPDCGERVFAPEA